MGKCTREAGVWVVAACSGRVALLEKSRDHLTVIPQGEGNIFPSLEDFSKAIRAAARDGLFDKLLIVGTPSDIAWLQMSLPAEAINRVVAEVQYPLLPAWFNQTPALPDLSHALERVLHS